jgi:hypothetical protein
MLFFSMHFLNLVILVKKVGGQDLQRRAYPVFFNLLRSLFPVLYIRPDELFIKAGKGLDRGKLPNHLEGMEISVFSILHSAKSAKSCLNSVHNGLNSKTSRYVLSKQ